MQSVCKRRKRGKRRVRNKPWWDDKLEAAKKFRYRCLRMVRLKHTSAALNEYKSAVKRFRNMYRSKEKEYRYKLKDRVLNSKDLSEIWKIVKANRKQRTCINNIKSEDWYDYFKMLLNTSNELDKIRYTLQPMYQRYPCFAQAGCARQPM